MAPYLATLRPQTSFSPPRLCSAQGQSRPFCLMLRGSTSWRPCLCYPSEDNWLGLLHLHPIACFDLAFVNGMGVSGFAYTKPLAPPAKWPHLPKSSADSGSLMDSFESKTVLDLGQVAPNSPAAEPRTGLPWWGCAETVAPGQSPWR